MKSEIETNPLGEENQEEEEQLEGQLKGDPPTI